MASDFWIVLQWWGTLFLVGSVAWPLTKRLFAGWFDHGYLFSKAVGMAVVTWIVYVMGTIRLMPFSVASIGVALGVVFVVGLMAHITNYELRITNYEGQTDKILIHNSIFILRRKEIWKKIILVFLEELFFLAALLFWSWVKAHEPSIRGLEKFMDYGFMQSILHAQFFPPADMWYAGLPVNYYYFGHMVTAVLTKLSGLDLAVTFNLMLATIFALTLTMSFSIGLQLIRIGRIGQIGSPRRSSGEAGRIGQIGNGLLTAFLVTLAGNMQTIYAFTRGYTGDPPAGGAKPFWELFWGIRDIGDVGVFGVFWGFWGKIGEGMNTYWYANATRFIPFTIHEFPSYSFVVSDVHGHVLSIPFVLLAIGMLIQVFLFQGQASAAGATRGQALWHGFYGFLIGVLLMTNALDGPIYLGLFAIILGISNFQFPISKWKKAGATLGLVAGVALLTSLPFLIHFKSFVTGVAVNCPPAFLANMKFGPILFEGIEKCQRSPLWMWWLLWGFFVYCGGGLIVKLVKLGKLDKLEKLLLIFFVFALVLVIVPEFIYFKDIYPMHFRSNTMFKLGYEAFILFSIVAGYAIVRMIGEIREIREKRGSVIFFLFLIPQLFLISIYPIFSVRSYFGGLKRYEGIDGLGWLRREYPGDWEAIEWMNGQMSSPTSLKLRGATMTGLPVIVEADGDSYTDYARVSAFTGNPTIIGWSVHEWLWRGTYDVVAPRREEVRQIYESQDVGVTSAILDKYEVRYVIVGKLEREKYKSLQEWKFGELGREAFRAGGTIIYERK